MHLKLTNHKSRHHGLQCKPFLSSGFHFCTILRTHKLNFLCLSWCI